MTRILALGGLGIEDKLFPDAEVDHEPRGERLYDKALAIHYLQTVPWTEVKATVEMIYAALKDDGELMLSVPDVSWAAEVIRDSHQLPPHVMSVVWGLNRGDLTETTERWHRSGFTPLTLRQLLLNSGFVPQESKVGPYSLTSFATDPDSDAHPEQTQEEYVARQIHVRAVKDTYAFEGVADE